ncbi:MAG: MCE family protein, partial [Marmoricola sp.]
MRSLRGLARRPVAAVVLLLVTALVATGCKFDGAYDLPLPGDKVDADDAYAVTADFADALNVVPRTAVFANDVPVGQVTDVERVGWHARVKFLVRKDIKLPENIEIDVRQTSLLGEKYIALVEPAPGTASSEQLSEGDVIPLSRTSRNPEVEEVLGALSALLAGGGVGQLKTISHELNAMMNGRQDQVRHLLGNLDRMVGGLNQQKDDIIAAMESIDRLSATLVKEKDVIGEAIDSMGPALKVLNRQHQGLMKMLRQLDKLGVVGTRVLNKSTDNIVASLRHLQPTLTRLGDVG